MTERYRLKRIRLDELSLVDVGANQHSLVAMLKRKEDEGMAKTREEMEKEMTADEKTRFKQMMEKEGLSMEEAYGKVMGMKKAAEAVIAAERLEKDVDALSKSLKTLEKALGEAGVKITKADDGSYTVEAPVTKAADETIEFAGQKIVKSQVDPGLFAVIKQQHEAIEKADAERRDAELAKRAVSAWPHLKGSEVAKGALLKAVEGIGDEGVRDEVRKSINAADAAFKEATAQTSFLSKMDDPDSPVAKLDKLAKERSKADGLTHEQAMTKVLETAEGRQLWRESRN